MNPLKRHAWEALTKFPAAKKPWCPAVPPENGRFALDKGIVKALGRLEGLWLETEVCPLLPLHGLAVPRPHLCSHLAVPSGVSVPPKLCWSRIPAGNARDAAAAALSDAMGQQAVPCPSPAAGAAGIRGGGWLGGTSCRKQSLLPLSCWELSSEPCGGTRWQLCHLCHSSAQNKR